MHDHTGISPQIIPQAQFKFCYPQDFVTLPDYTAHRDVIVTVIRQLTEKEAGGMERMFEVRAQDGWTGHAFESELL